MSHDISIVNGVAEAAFARQPAWHGLGALVGDHMTVDEALDAAHLRWEVNKHPLFFEHGERVPDRVAVRRSDTNLYLGTVGKHWTPVQNEEQARFIESLTGEGATVVECVGALREGRRTFWTVKVPNDLYVGGVDQVSRYLIICNGHDGSLAFRAFWSPIRVVCSNTLNASMRRDGGVKEGVALFHRSKVMSAVDAARKVLGLADSYYERLGQSFEAMLDRDLSDAEFRLYVETVIPASAKDGGPTEMEEVARRSIIENYFEKGTGREMAGRTLWGAYNAVTEYVDHQKEYSSPERRFENILLGGSREIQQKAFATAKTVLASGEKKKDSPPLGFSF